jgi:predicted Na+-dependent transporter
MSTNQTLPQKTAGLSATAAKINRFLDRLMPIIAPLGVALGLLLSFFFIKFRPFIPWIFGTITLSGALKLKARELVLAVKNPLPIVFFFVTAHFFMPLVVLFLSSVIFGNDADTISGYVLLYSVPTAVSGFIWVTIYRGDSALTLALILLDTILAPVVVPGTVRLFLGTQVTMDMSGMAISLIYMVVIPTIIGVALNEMSRGAVPKAIGPYMGPLSKICLIVVIAANSAAVASQINPQNKRLWIIGAVCIGFVVLGFSCAKLMGILARRLGILGKSSKGKEVSLFFASGLRNTSAAMTLGIDFFPGPAALPAVLGIVFQQTICALMAKLYMGKISSEDEKS